MREEPVVIRDTPMAWGFVTNRVYFAMVAEAQKVVNEGIATADDVDQLMMDCFRWPTGPFGMVQGASSGWGLEPLPFSAAKSTNTERFPSENAGPARRRRWWGERGRRPCSGGICAARRRPARSSATPGS